MFHFLKTGLAGFLLGAGLVSLTACGNQNAAIIQAAVPAVQTLASLAAANNKQISEIVNAGQLFCQSDAGLVAVVGDLSGPTSVAGKSAAVVAAACPIINGVQTKPAPVSAIPVVVSPGAAALKPGTAGS